MAGIITVVIRPGNPHVRGMTTIETYGWKLRASLSDAPSGLVLLLTLSPVVCTTG